MNKARLLKLAKHLKSGKLGHKNFDFSCFNEDDSGNSPVHKCGTNGCAIGECPILFPRSWYFDDTGFPKLKNEEHFMSLSCAAQFFGISYTDAQYLFIPHECSIFPYVKTTIGKRKPLGGTATKTQVADNIIKYVEAVERKNSKKSS